MLLNTDLGGKTWLTTLRTYLPIRVLALGRNSKFRFVCRLSCACPADTDLSLFDFLQSLSFPQLNILRQPYSIIMELQLSAQK